MIKRFVPQVGKSLMVLSCLLLGASMVQAAPMALGDRTLDQVTAGSSEVGGSGGAIIGNSSEATINQTGGVDLSDEVQMGAKGLNLVNSSESTVANGVNIWDVTSSEAGADNGQMSVEQSNIINQEQRRSASMPNYSRPEANTSVEIELSGSESHDIQLDRNNNVLDVQTLSSDAQNTSTASVDTTIKGGGQTNATTDSSLPASPEVSVDTNVGKGLAVAGQVDTFIDGGEAQIGLAVGGAVIAAPDTITASQEGRPAESYGGMAIGNDDSEFAIYGRLILPEIDIEINGAGCGVAMGSCESGGTANLLTTETKDQSLMDSEVSSSTGNSEYVDNRSEIYRSPFELTDAQAEYIVVDDSSLAVNTTFNLTMSGSAQSNVSGMNVVNATGSAVADGVNVARTSQLAGGAMALSQTNVISHSR